MRNERKEDGAILKEYVKQYGRAETWKYMYWSNGKGKLLVGSITSMLAAMTIGSAYPYLHGYFNILFIALSLVYIGMVDIAKQEIIITYRAMLKRREDEADKDSK